MQLQIIIGALGESSPLRSSSATQEHIRPADRNPKSQQSRTLKTSRASLEYDPSHMTLVIFIRVNFAVHARRRWFESKSPRRAGLPRAVLAPPPPPVDADRLPQGCRQRAAVPRCWPSPSPPYAAADGP